MTDNMYEYGLQMARKWALLNFCRFSLGRPNGTEVECRSISRSLLRPLKTFSRQRESRQPWSTWNVAHRLVKHG